MTAPRTIERFDYVMCSTRVVRRHFLLRPNGELNDVVRYLLAHYAKKHRIVLLAACVMSDHVHWVIHDPNATRPDFLRDVHRGIARYVKDKYDWADSVFVRGSSQVRLLTREAIVEKIAYVLANPVVAGAVRRGRDWPGLRTRVNEMGRRAVEVKRPTNFYCRLPKKATLQWQLPPSLVDEFGKKGTRQMISEEVARQERAARSERRKFWGVEKCRAVKPTKRGTKREPRNGRNPVFAVGRKNAEALKRALDELRKFRKAYSIALSRWKSGVRNVMFPSGTYKMRVVHLVSCAPL